MTGKKATAFVGGEIITVDEFNKLNKFEAMLIQDGKIVYLGEGSGLDAVPAAKDAEYIDIQGKCIMPGFTDSHLHASSMAELIFDTDILLSQPGTMFPRAEAVKMYRERLIENMDKTGPAQVIRGAGWDPGIFMASTEGLPTAADLDGVADDKPVILRSYDHHYVWLNKKALEVSGVNAETPEPRNGRIYRNKDGNPTGLFQENTAIDMVLGKIPGAGYSVEEYKTGIRAFQQNFGNPLGMTMVFDAYNPESGMQAYYELAQAGELKLRVKTCFYADPAKPADQFDKMIADKEKYNVGDLFGVDTVKFFIDGTALTFCLHEPFEAEWLKSIGMPEDYSGYAQWDQEELNEIFLKLSKAGFQIHIHCMGDKATTMALDAFEHVDAQCSVKPLRHTIAHLMQVKEADIERMGRLGIVSAMQPMWAQYASLAEMMSSVSLGMDRVLDQYRIGSLLKAGSVVSFGTDFPVTIPPSPILGIQCAVTRSVTTNQPDYEQYKERKLGPLDDPARDCITPAESIGACCYGGAYQCFMENITGSLEVGKSADFVIMSEPFTGLADNEIEKLQVEATYFRGECVYNK